MHMIVFVALAAAIAVSTGELIPYRGTIVNPSQPLFLAIPKYAPNEVPDWSPGNGRSFIDFGATTLKLKCGSDPCHNSTFDIMILRLPEDKHKKWISYWPEEALCCTEDMVQQGYCAISNLNSLIEPYALESYKKTIPLSPHEEKDLAQVVGVDINIKKSGIYIVLMAVCNPDGIPVRVNGDVENMNPYGYLPAELFGDLPLYGTLAALYVACGIVWMIVLYYHKAEVFLLQNWISLVMFLGMLECMLMLSHFIHWNDYGIVDDGIHISAQVFGALKRTFSRVLVIMFGSGYGIIKFSLGDFQHVIMVICTLYFIFTLLYALNRSATNTAQQTSDADSSFYHAVFIFCLTLLDVSCFFLALAEVEKVTKLLKDRNQPIKLRQFSIFHASLYAMVFCGVLWLFYASKLIAHSRTGEWRMWWSIDGVWEIGYFVMLCLIAFLWMPSHTYKWMDFIEMTPVNSRGKVHAGEQAIVAEYGGAFDDDDEDEHAMLLRRGDPELAAKSS